jgi:hypothetical protein
MQNAQAVADSGRLGVSAYAVSVVAGTRYQRYLHLDWVAI